MIEWILYVVAISIFLIQMILHELGHRKMAWHLGYDAEIKLKKKPGKIVPDIVTEWEDRVDNIEHERKILIAGLLAGAVPLFFMVLLFDYFGFLLIMNFILYFIVSRSDITRVLEIQEEEDEMQ